jgi:hypothetical protein
MLPSISFKACLCSFVLCSLSLFADYTCGGVVTSFSFDNSTVAGSTIFDTSGNGYSGQLSSGVTSGQAGRFGESFYFSGSNSEIKIPYNTTPTFGNSFTFAYWMKVAAADLSRPAYVLQRGGVHQNALIFGYNTATAEIFAPTRTGADPRSASAIPSVQGDTWNHIAYTYDGGVLRNYLNGTEIANTAITFSLTATANGALFIGSPGNEFVNASNFRGYLDDLSIWNEPLSAAGVAALYNGPPTAAVPEPGTGVFALALTGGVGFGIWRKRRGQKVAEVPSV